MPYRNQETMMNKRTGLLLALFPMYCLADSVVPIEKVSESVNIRLSPDATSEIVGKLEQGSSAEIVNSIEGWHEVKLVGGATGFISADWTRVISDEEAAAEAPVAGEVEAAAVAATEPVVEPVTQEIVEVAVEEAAAEVAEEAAEEVVEATVEATAEAAVEETVAAPVEEAAEAVAVETVAASVEAAAEETVATAVEEAEVAVTEPVIAEAIEVAVPTEKAARANLKGTKDFLVKFRNQNEGENSQIFDNGNQVGIGTTEPKQRLEVNGSIQIHEQNSNVAGLMITQSSGDTGYIMHNRASTLTIGAGSQDRITIDRDGNVGIAVSRPRHPLEMASGAHVTAGGVWTNSSSRERKENIAELQLDAATDTLMALQPVVFNYRNEVGENYVGFIAEDVPELVAVTDRTALSAMDIVAVLTRVVQEQQNKIQALEARLDAL
jgi:hypothetical protein